MHHLFGGKTQAAGIRQYDSVVILDDHRAPANEVIGMNERVGDSLTNGLIHRIVINPMQIGIKLERMGNSRPQTIDHLAPKIVQVARPRVIVRSESVVPPLLVVHDLAIVQEIVGEFGRDSPRLTEHQQSGSCGTHLRTIKPQRFDAKQEILIRQSDPWMAGPSVLELPTI